jgi:hypothetical protein
VTNKGSGRKELDEATEALNQALCDAEDILAQINFGVSVDVLLEAEPMRHLGFHKGKLVVISPGGEINPVTSVSRRLRVLVPARLRELYEALVEESKTQTKSVQAATEIAESFVRAHYQARCDQQQE